MSFLFIIGYYFRSLNCRKKRETMGERILFEICNCNNINKASIEILPNFLNIKYASNGTGKSTIAKAIKLFSESNRLDDLQPYGVGEKPNVDSNPPVTNVLIFNEDFVNNFVFLKNEVMENSFEVFIKSNNYDEKLEALNERLKNLRIDLKQDEDISEMREIIKNVTSKFTINDDGELRNNPFLKSLISREHIFNIPKNLEHFRPFIESNYNVNWIDWKNKGYAYDDMNKCPFCTEDLKPFYETEKSTFKVCYTKSNAQNMKDMLSFFESLQKYISEEKFELLNNCIKCSSDEDLIRSLLKQFVNELRYIEEKVNKIVNFDSYRIRSEEISQLDNKLNDLKISPVLLDVFNSLEMKKIVTRINENIDSTLGEVTSLKKEVGVLKGLIQATAKKSISDINNFLESAGISYEIIIEVLSESDSKTVLKYKDRNENTHEVDDIKKHLSWGEKNAFALVLFMHYATSNNADLIILDDPISSFDSDKKYAIINRLFKNNGTDRTFYNKTVLLLTHDFEPVIDFIVNGKPSNEFVSAVYIVNKNGIISETKINKDNVLSQIYLLNTVIEDNNINIIHRLVAIRKLIDHTLKTDEEKFAYSIISSLIHGKEIPYTKIGNEIFPMNSTEIDSGNSYIKNRIPIFSYEQVQNENLTSESLINAYNNESCSYLKLQLFRVFLQLYGRRAGLNNVLLKYIDETYHIENDFLYTLDYRKFDIVPDFIMKKCNEYIRAQSTI